LDTERRDELKRSILGADASALESGGTPRLMLDFRPKRGEWLALPYTALRSVRYDPDDRPVVSIEFSSHVIEVEGRKLEGLYLAVVSQRASTIAEVQELYLDEEESRCFVERLTIRRKAQRGAEDRPDDRG